MFKFINLNFLHIKIFQVRLEMAFKWIERFLWILKSGYFLFWKFLKTIFLPRTRSIFCYVATKKIFVHLDVLTSLSQYCQILFTMLTWILFNYYLCQSYSECVKLFYYYGWCSRLLRNCSVPLIILHICSICIGYWIEINIVGVI